MKKVYLLMFVLSLGLTTIAQNKNVGIGTKSPDNSAVLDIQSVDKGLLIPRLSLEQRNAINSPANGLLVYQTNENSGFYFFNGKNWAPLAGNEAKSVALDVQNWSKTGDAGTNPASNFLGTTDLQPLIIKTNNVQSGVINPSTGLLLLGYRAGLNMTGLNSLGLGKDVLGANGVGSTGSNNTAIGVESMAKNTTGNNNMSIGSFAMRNNLTGNLNVAIGGSALTTLSTGSNNTGIGFQALYNNNGNENFGLGVNSLYANSIGNNNLALGSYSLSSNQTGGNNSALGLNSLFSNVSGFNNMAIGVNALYSSTGSNNIGIGVDAGRTNTGSNNIFIGYQSGFNETGSNKLYISNSNTSNPLIKGDFLSNTLLVNSKTTGYLAIGDFDALTPMPTPAGYRLIVQDGILSEKIKVALRTSSTDWADYVFEPEYKAKMMKLEEVEQFTLKNKHLPNVPSADDMVKEGLDVGKTSKMFMEKIEELTLYLIEMNKEIKALKAENEALKKK